MKTITFFLLLFLAPNLFSQGWKEYISKNALPVGSDLSLDTSVYKHFKDYKLILMGEMHGTMEPAKMVEQLACLILLNEDSVSVGLEIPIGEMEIFQKAPSNKTLAWSQFFSKPNEDGRNSTAWFELIKYCMNEPRIHLFFFDTSPGSCFGSRDEWMYNGVKYQAITHPTEKILTLSGNLHNQMVPAKIPDRDNAFYKPMGFYCAQDTLTFSPGSICSVCHYYSKGTMLNNTGDGLELQKIKNPKSDFSSSSLENYFLFYPPSTGSSPFNCVLFTKKVHHSESLNEKKQPL